MQPEPLALDGAGHRPAPRDGLPPWPVATVERRHEAVVDDPQALADRLQEAPVMGDHEDRRRGLGEEALDRLAGVDIEVVGGLVEEKQVGGRDPEEGELEAAPLAAREEPDLLEGVVAAEEEAGEVASEPRRASPGWPRGGPR